MAARYSKRSIMTILYGKLEYCKPYSLWSNVKPLQIPEQLIWSLPFLLPTFFEKTWKSFTQANTIVCMIHTQLLPHPFPSIPIYSQLPLLRTMQRPQISVLISESPQQREFISVKRLYFVFAGNLVAVRIVGVSVIAGCLQGAS